MNAAIVIARGGSKRIPGKNIKPFANKPVIQYSIEVAREAGVFDRIITSTDSDEIAEVARAAGAEIPFRRPAELADDHTPTADVLIHAIRWLNRFGSEVRYACGIYPTAPFLRAADLRAGLELLRDKGAAVVVPVTTYASPIQRALERDEKGALRMLWPEHELTRSNDLPEVFHDAGQFYWLDAEAFLQSGRLYGPATLPLELPRQRVHDLDTPEDWDLAERYHEADRIRERRGR